MDRIKEPGKFEGEFKFAPYYWDCLQDGFCDSDVNGYAFFIVSKEDIAEYPELEHIYGVSLWESDNGFVYTRVYWTQAKYDAALQSATNEEIIAE